MSAYAYTFLNPIRFIDPDGMDGVPAYYMNFRGYYIDGDETFGEYVGNVRPSSRDHDYFEIAKLDNVYFHKNTKSLDCVIEHFFNPSATSHGMKRYTTQDASNHDLIMFTTEMAVTGYVVGKVFGVAGTLLKQAGNSLWKIAPLQRGFVYETMLNLKGAFKVSNYPVIDAFYNGVATSIKTIDLGAKTYLKGNAVYNKLAGYIDDLARFQGTNFGGVNTTNLIKNKVLEVGIPKGATSAQVNQINKAIQHAANNGIQMNVRVVN